jgi:transcriptional regulator with XRE-family HTH domain
MSPRNDQARNVANVEPESFGAQLRRLREDRGLSQDALGNAIGTSQKEISAYERNRQVPRDDKLIALADALDIPASQLFEATRFHGTLVIDPELRADLYQMRPREIRMLKHVAEALKGAPPEELATFEEGFRQFLKTWK